MEVVKERLVLAGLFGEKPEEFFFFGEEIIVLVMVFHLHEKLPVKELSGPERAGEKEIFFFVIGGSLVVKSFRIK